MDNDALREALADRYVIERELGAGGAATVYLARDLRHDRSVAVKVLRSEVSSSVGPERFAQEIAIAARLQHPHILMVLDSGEAAGSLFYVMPYVEGDSLQRRLAVGGELPVSDAVRILQQVADALAFAHERGFVHRDIKPANILLAGRHAMVADFGVAKALSEAHESDGLTTVGVALGTPAYMAPEQAAAEPNIDHRADIFSLGVVAYEMLAGVQPFSGGSPHALMAARLTQTPVPLLERRSSVSPEISHVVMKCLERSPADRWQDAGQVVQELEGLVTPSGGVPPASRPVVARVGGRAAWITAGVLALAVGAVAWNALGRSEIAAGPGVTALEVEPVTLTGTADRPAISPDGLMLAYVERDSVLLVRDLPDGRPVTLATRADLSSNPVRWSPDGSRIAYAAGGDVFVTPRLGGRQQPVPRGGEPFAFHPDGRLSVLDEAADQLLILDAQAEVVEDSVPIPLLPEGRFVDFGWSPDGRWIAGVHYFGIEVFDARGARTAAWGTTARQNLSWDPAGTALLYFDALPNYEHNLVRVPIAPDDGSAGEEEILLTGINTVYRGDVSLTADGAHIYFVSGQADGELLYFEDLEGPVSRRFELGSSWLGTPVMSPSGDRVALARGDQLGDNIYVLSLADGSAEPISRLTHMADVPAWSPDETRVAFVYVDPAGRISLMVSEASGAGPPRPVVNLPLSWGAIPVWLSDDRLAFTSFDTTFVVGLDGTVHERFSTPGLWGIGVASPTGDRMVAMRTDEDDFVLVSLESGEVVGGPMLRDAWVWAWPREDALIAVQDGQFVSVRPRDGMTTPIGAVSEECNGMAYTRDGRAVACVHRRSSTDVWRARLERR